MKIFKRIVATLLATLIVIGLCACGKKDNSTAKNAQLESLREYAEELEKAGNSEAAAAVYELIAKGGGAEFIQKAHEDIPVINAADEIEQIQEVLENNKGGDGK